MSDSCLGARAVAAKVPELVAVAAPHVAAVQVVSAERSTRPAMHATHRFGVRPDTSTMTSSSSAACHSPASVVTSSPSSKVQINQPVHVFNPPTVVAVVGIADRRACRLLIAIRKVAHQCGCPATCRMAGRDEHPCGAGFGRAADWRRPQCSAGSGICMHSVNTARGGTCPQRRSGTWRSAAGPPRRCPARPSPRCHVLNMRCTHSCRHLASA